MHKEDGTMIDMYFLVQELNQVMSSEKVGGHFYLHRRPMLVSIQYNSNMNVKYVRKIGGIIVDQSVNIIIYNVIFLRNQYLIMFLISCFHIY